MENIRGESKRGFASFTINSPSLTREGDKGGRLLDNFNLERLHS